MALRFILSIPMSRRFIPGMRKLRNVEGNVAADEKGPLPAALQARLRNIVGFAPHPPGAVAGAQRCLLVVRRGRGRRRGVLHLRQRPRGCLLEFLDAIERGRRLRIRADNFQHAFLRRFVHGLRHFLNRGHGLRQNRRGNV